jgi:hypothetical protein
MPRRRSMPLQTNVNRDIPIIRRAVEAGIPWTSPDQHHELTRHLTMEQRYILNRLVPQFKTVAEFLCDLDVTEQDVQAAKLALANDITAAERKFTVKEVSIHH